MKKISKLFALGLGCLLALSLCGCGGNKVPPEAKGRTLIEYFACYDTYSLNAYRKLVDTYNNGQGAEDNVYVQVRLNAGNYAQYMSTLSKNCRYSVVTIPDSDFKTLAVNNFFIPLDGYLTDEVKTEMQWDQIPDGLTNRFRLNATKNAAGKYEAGAGTNLLGLPLGSNPHVLYYSTAAMDKAGINMISVAEEQLAAFNTANNGKIQPHGYAEYATAPFTGAKESANEAGERVYKVFNNRIAMNWAEQRCLARAFQKQYNYLYGYVSEWWFNYGFSVGADCMGWDETKGAYVLTLGDKTDNWLALEDMTVNGTPYRAGDVIFYEDKAKMTADDRAKAYKLPSTYDMMLEFLRLSVSPSLEVEPGYAGYGVAEYTKDMSGHFLSGQNAMLAYSYSGGNSFANTSLGSNWNYAPLCVYKEFEGGSTYQKNDAAGFANEYLKVIGKEYGGQTYTGELKKAANGTPIVGEHGGASAASALCIPRTSDASKYDAAAKFITWVAGPEGQAILAESNAVVPNQSEIGKSDAFSADASRPADNAWAAAYMAEGADLGDYSYFQTDTWVNDWADDFNDYVRNGTQYYSTFLENKQARGDNNLSKMTVRIFGR